MTSLNGYIQGLGSGADRIVRKTGTEIKLSVYDNIDRVIVFNEAGETSQEGTPTPSDPVDIVGIGVRQQDGTYTVRIDYDDGDERFGSITASGLAYPLYEGDVLDFVNGKVIRNNGCIDMGSLSYTMYSASNGNAFVVTLPNGKQISNTYNSGIKCTSYSEDTPLTLRLISKKRQSSIKRVK